jgi:thiol:disulfide interchange protein
MRRSQSVTIRLFTILLTALLELGRLASAQIQVVGDGGPGPVKAQHLTAELVSLAPGIAPGGTLQVGLTLTLEEHWHVYWVNAGDSGEPPKIKWTLPDGITAGPMQFPIPERLPLGPLMDFGYEDGVTFPVLLTAAPGVKSGPVHLDAQVHWLVCSAATCLPGKAHLGLTLNVAPGSAPGQPLGALGQALSQLPKPLPPGAKFTITGGKTAVLLTLDTGKPEPDAEFYPFDQDVISNAAEQSSETTPTGVKLPVFLSPDLTALPKTLHGVLKISDDLGYEVSAPVVPGAFELPTRASKPKAATGSELTAIPAIGLAFLGGIILNLMPCVFPVLFLKGLALVQASGEERKRLRGHGLIYTLGILVSFWVIVAVLLGLRAGGSQAGWGFQLQSPVFIAVLACGIFFFALSLAGQFDLGLSLTSVGGDLAQKQGYVGSFFTGVLATVVATPCTAPLMGAAIGFALAQPAGITFAVFTALGLGLAVPYLALSFQPAWTRVLPKPGAWMEVLKQLTAVPLFATAIWLAYVYGQLYPGDQAGHVAWLLCGFLVLAIAGWTLGRWPLRWASGIAALVLCGIALAFPLSKVKTATLKWEPYSSSALEAARTSGKPVFIDFTAAWCLSCQVNEKLVLDSKEIQSGLRSHDFVLMRADWTSYDPEITKELATLGRSGVPTYVIYPPASGATPDVLPEVLTKSLVHDAIEKDGAK